MADNDATFAIVYQKGDKVSFGEIRLEDVDGALIRKLKKNEIEERDYIDGDSLYRDLRIKSITMRHNVYPYRLIYSAKRITDSDTHIASVDWQNINILVNKGILTIDTRLDKPIKFRGY